MVEPAVSFVVQKLGQLLIQETALLHFHGVHGQVEELLTELKRMLCFLRDVDSKPKVDERDQMWIEQIKKAAYDTEDVINTFNFEVVSRRKGGGGLLGVFKRWVYFLQRDEELHKFVKEMRAIQARIANIGNRQETLEIKTQNHGKDEGVNSANELGLGRQQLRRPYPHVEDDEYIIELQKDTEGLVKELIKEEHNCGVVAIIGMGGLGKTTLAKKVYNHHNVKNHFDCRGWAFVSQNFSKIEVMRQILRNVISIRIDVNAIDKMREEDLEEELYKNLKEKRYLVVLDDIQWDNWINGLKPSFPDGKAGSKIMLTTRNEEVIGCFVHEPRRLTKDDCWTLLCKKVIFPENNATTSSVSSPPSPPPSSSFVQEVGFKDLGLMMVEKCGNLPLAVTVLGGLLGTKESLNEWKSVYEKLDSNKNGVLGILALSYNELPIELKKCLLYMSLFPKDFKLPKKKLIRLWVAQGFITLKEEEIEDVADGYLAELIGRGIVQVDEVDLMGAIKTCHLHELIRYQCISKWKVENFINFIPPFPMRVTIIERSHKDFKSLRVLDLHVPIPGNSLRNLKTLIHLRYLGLRDTCIRKLSPSIGNLKYLQTLDLLGNSGLILPNVIWKMEHLRHLCLPEIKCGGGQCLRMDTLTNLQTLKVRDLYGSVLVPINPVSNSLRTLRFVTPSETTMESVLESKLDDLSSLTLCLIAEKKFGPNLVTTLPHCTNLLQLKLVGCIVEENSNPYLEFFPSHLTKLTLRYSLLKEDPMPALGKLPHLKLLHLDNSSYIGRNMLCSAKGFPQLQVLQFNYIGIEGWIVEKEAMPKLKHLEIRRCLHLKMVPEGLRFITTLRELKISEMTSTFRERLKKGGKDLDKVKHIHPYSTFISSSEKGFKKEARIWTGCWYRHPIICKNTLSKTTPFQNSF